MVIRSFDFCDDNQQNNNNKKNSQRKKKIKNFVREIFSSLFSQPCLIKKFGEEKFSFSSDDVYIGQLIDYGKMNFGYDANINCILYTNNKKYSNNVTGIKLNLRFYSEKSIYI